MILPEPVRSGLRLRAVRKGHSMEAEARAILAEAVRGETEQALDPGLLQDFISGLFKKQTAAAHGRADQGARREARKERR